MNTVLEIKGLSKNYGRVRALDNLDLSVEKGAVYGLLGPNGSGKTTTLGIVLGVVHATSGTFEWFGENPEHTQRKKIGAILEHPNFVPYLSADNNLKLVADIKQADKRNIPLVMEKVGLSSRSGDAFKTYSLGMKQRLSIAAALLGNPEVLILDEPTNGLDPQGIAEIRNLILEIAAEGITVVLASHLLDEVQRVCSHVAILNSGKKLYSGTVEGILSGAGAIEVAAVDMFALEHVLQKIPGDGKITRDGKILIFEHPDFTDPGSLSAVLAKQGIAITHLAVRNSNLEKDFLALLASQK